VPEEGCAMPLAAGQDSETGMITAYLDKKFSALPPASTCLAEDPLRMIRVSWKG